MASYTDDFNRADGALTTPWENNLFGGTVSIESHLIRGESTGGNGGGYARYIASIDAENQSSILTIVSINGAITSYGNGYAGPLVRVSGSGSTLAMYQAAARHDQVEIFAFWNNFANSALLLTEPGVNDGDIIRLTATGGFLFYYVNGVIFDGCFENVNVPRLGYPGVAIFNGSGVPTTTAGPWTGSDFDNPILLYPGYQSPYGWK